MAKAADPSSASKVTIKKYANRRLYDTESSSYITLDRLEQNGYRFVVVRPDWAGPGVFAIYAWLQRNLANGRLAFVRHFDYASNGDWVFAVTRNVPHWQSLRAPDQRDPAENEQHGPCLVQAPADHVQLSQQEEGAHPSEDRSARGGPGIPRRDERGDAETDEDDGPPRADFAGVDQSEVLKQEQGAEADQDDAEDGRRHPLVPLSRIEVHRFLLVLGTYVPRGRASSGFRPTDAACRRMEVPDLLF